MQLRQLTRDLYSRGFTDNIRAKKLHSCAAWCESILFAQYYTFSCDAIGHFRITEISIQYENSRKIIILMLGISSFICARDGANYIYKYRNELEEKTEKN